MLNGKSATSFVAAVESRLAEPCGRAGTACGGDPSTGADTEPLERPSLVPRQERFTQARVRVLQTGSGQPLLNGRLRRTKTFPTFPTTAPLSRVKSSIAVCSYAFTP